MSGVGACNTSAARIIGHLDALQKQRQNRYCFKLLGPRFLPQILKHLNILHMKKLLVFAMLFGATFSPLAGNANNTSQDYIVIEDNVLLCVPNTYMNARYVRVDLIANNGSIQATAYTLPGGTVSFNTNDASRLVRSYYHFEGADYIIADDCLTHE